MYIHWRPRDLLDARFTNTNIVSVVQLCIVYCILYAWWDKKDFDELLSDVGVSVWNRNLAPEPSVYWITVDSHSNVLRDLL